MRCCTGTIAPPRRDFNGIKRGAGMSPARAIQAATVTNAEVLGWQNEIGSIEKGKYADLIVVNGNPLKNLRVFQNQDNLRVIMKGGRTFKRTL